MSGPSTSRGGTRGDPRPLSATSVGQGGGRRRGPIAPRGGGGGSAPSAARPGLAAPLLSFVGLLLVAAVTATLFTGRLPILPVGGGGGIFGERTPAPSNIVVVDPRTKIPGSLVYAKSGNVWIQSGSSARQLTSGGTDSMPSWSPDGAWVYYVSTKTKRGLYPSNGTPTYFDLTYPEVYRIRPDGTDRERIATGRLTRSSGRYEWFYWIRQPVADPTGTLLAVVSDGPDPTNSNVVLQLLDIETGKLRRLDVPETAPLGHQDPAWRPGPGPGPLLYVMNGRDGARGASSIWRWDPKTGKAKALSAPGYMGPAWAPDGTLVAATKQRSGGTDVVILDAATGDEVVRVTSDGRSWGATWSPAGDAIAYLHIESGIIDLRLVPVDRTGVVPVVGPPLDLTQTSGLDPASRPGWWIPPELLPSPTPTPAPTPTGGPSASPSGGG